MKKYVLFILLIIPMLGFGQKLDWKTFKPISESYYFVDDVLYTSTSLIVRNDYDYIPAQKIIWIGNADSHVLRVYGSRDVIIEGLDIKPAPGLTTTTGIYISDSGTVSILNCKIKKTKWGIRAFQGFNSKIIIKYCSIDSTYDDNIYGQNTNDWDISYSSFTNPNMWQTGGGGDCIQLAYRQNNINIHHCYFDHSSSVYKFCVIVGSDDYVLGSLNFHYNTVIARKRYDSSELPNTGMYLKPKVNFFISNNTFRNGANAIYMRDAKPCNISIWNNYFQGQEECIYLNAAWNISIYNNIFADASKKFLWGSAVGDSIYNNIFYPGTDVLVMNFFNNTPAFSDNLINPDKVYGCSFNLLAKDTVKIVDTVTYIRTVFNTVNDTVIYNDTITETKYNIVQVIDTVGLHDILEPLIKQTTYEIKLFKIN